LIPSEAQPSRMRPQANIQANVRGCGVLKVGGFGVHKGTQRSAALEEEVVGGGRFSPHHPHLSDQRRYIKYSQDQILAMAPM
jgi:hypothetical protein